MPVLLSNCCDLLLQRSRNRIKSNHRTGCRPAWPAVQECILPCNMVLARQNKPGGFDESLKEQALTWPEHDCRGVAYLQGCRLGQR